MVSTRTGWGKAPAHVTGFFAPALDADDPRARGSIGAGLVLGLGVRARARWRPSVRRSVRVRTDVTSPTPISLDVATRMLAGHSGRLEVTLRHDLPVGQGFGMSAAGALATAMAVAGALGLRPARAVETAHLADLFGGGGLGGVSAILGGGLEVRSRPGIPPWGEVTHFPAAKSVFVVVAGPAMPSQRLLANPVRFRRAVEGVRAALGRVRRTPTLERFFEEAERFTDSVRIASPTLRQLLQRVRSADSWAAQTMFGRALVVLPRRPAARGSLVRELTRRRLSAVEIPIAGAGASGGAGATPERQAF